MKNLTPGIGLFVFFIALSNCTPKTAGSDASTHTKSPRSQPNIVLILADDLGYGDVSALNPESKIQTPVLDQLIKEGMHFTEAHTSASICTPTRYALLTGRYSFRTGLNGVATGYAKPLIESKRETLASLLKKAGYTTACIGKWHLGLEWQPKNPSKPLVSEIRGNRFMPETSNVDYTQLVKGVNEVGFDYSFISPGGNNIAPLCFVKNGKVEIQPTDVVAPQLQGHTYETRRNGGDKAPGYQFNQTLGYVVEKGINYLQNVEKKDKPFFLYLPLTAPHFPWAPDEEFRGTSKAGLYGDFVQEIDYRIGQIVKTLKDHQLDDNTLIIFTADNGGADEPFFKQYNHEMNYGRKGQKHQIWEGGVRVPFIAHWKGVIAPGAVVTERISLVDMLATFSGLTGQPLNPMYGEDSYDISPLLLGDSLSVARGPMINQGVRSTALSITKNGWKLIPYGHGDNGLNPAKPGEPKGMLFNLKEDPMEANNVYAQNPEKVVELSDLLEQYKAQGFSRKVSGRPD